MCRVTLASMRMARDADIEVSDGASRKGDHGPVLEVTATWRDYMSDAGLGASGLELLERCFAMREVVERWHAKAARATGS